MAIPLMPASAPSRGTPVSAVAKANSSPPNTTAGRSAARIAGPTPPAFLPPTNPAMAGPIAGSQNNRMESKIIQSIAASTLPRGLGCVAWAMGPPAGKMLPAEILRRPGRLPLTAAVLLDELSPCVEVTYLFDAASADFGDDVESMSLSGDPTQPALAPEEAQQADQNARPARALGKCTNLPE